MSYRYKFGPRLVGSIPRPDVPGESPDPEVTAKIANAKAGDPGKVNFDVVMSIPAYDPAKFNTVAEVHAVHFPDGAGIPTDPTLALAAPYPKGSADTSQHFAGGDIPITIAGAETGVSTVLTILAMKDVPAPVATPQPTAAS